MKNRSFRTAIVFMSLIFIGHILVFDGLHSEEKSHYTDAEEILENFAELMEDFIGKMDKAQGAVSIAEALGSFSASMEEAVPKINEIMAKYPELRDESTHPEDMKPLLERLNQDFQDLMKSYAKVMDHIEDPAVKEADTKYRQVMAELK